MKERICKNCGEKINDKAVVCTHCGAKVKKSLTRKWWFWLIVVLVVMSVAVTNNDNDTNADKGTNNASDKINSSNEELVLSEDEYKAQCSTIPYKDIERNPNDYVGQLACFEGKVAQIQENGKNVVLRVNTTEGQYGLWEDTIYVDYRRKSDNESRILEDDMVTVYGEIKGIKDYRAVLGNQISIPHINAEYVDIH